MVEVVDGTDQCVHLNRVDFLVFGFEALGQTGREIAVGVKRYVLFSVNIFKD